ncbi:MULTISPECIES: hypothetical protein [Microcoleaceae]|nr:hypothetical protein [Tychonema sp. LEGE 06208]
MLDCLKIRDTALPRVACGDRGRVKLRFGSITQGRFKHHRTSKGG